MARRRELVAGLRDEFPLATLCRVSGLSPSSFHYRPHAPDDTALRAAIERLAQEYPRYGSRRITRMLRRERWRVNRKRVQRLMRESCLLVQIRRLVRTSVYRPGLGHWPNLLKTTAITHPNQVWVGDITYVRVRSQFVFVAVLMDVYTRAIRGWNLEGTLETSLVRGALEMALREHPAPAIHHSDHGVQYLSTEYRALLDDSGVTLSLSSIGRPTENGYCERVMRTLKEEEVSMQEYESVGEARERIGRFLMAVYNDRRIHSSLGYLTPSEFETAHRAGTKTGPRSEGKEPAKTKKKAPTKPKKTG